MQSRAKITAADIARLAGVGRAAVSNWRKRYESFPRPVGGTAASPQFDLDEVEQWLSEQGKLPAVADEDRLWRSLLAVAEGPAEALAVAGEHLLGRQALPFEELRPALDALSAAIGEEPALEALWDRFADQPGQRAVTTPDALADLMVTLAGVRAGSVLDPACGTGRLLRAATRAGAEAVYGQDNDAAATRLASLWLGSSGSAGEIRTGDSLRHDGFPDLTVNAVVANLPFGLTNWGHEELGYDRRWEFGVPPRTEPELAWVQHALAHLTTGGRAVLLMPPSAAGRRAGRRIRAELLRRGVVRAVVALPPGAAAPHAVGLHLWVLERDVASPASDVLFVDAGTEPLDLAFKRITDAVERGGALVHSVPVVELLDDEVDLTPGRRGHPGPSGPDFAAAVFDDWKRLSEVLDSLHELLPAVSAIAEPGIALPSVSVADLIRSGHLQLLGPVRVGSADSGSASEVLVLTSDDVLQGRPAGRADLRPAPLITLEPGDVVVPTAAFGLSPRVIVDGGPLLGRGLHLLRSDQQSLDPWFLAGYLRTSANERQTGSSSGSQRSDVRRAQVPRIPVEEQRRHGSIFRKLQQFDMAVRAATVIGDRLTRQTADGLAAGALTPNREDDASSEGTSAVKA
ncbi:N-6 DNA methylase [Paractinoplanes maris]|uniref:N-6 DNA methylase n=1 Tax=Paractinoplanes maris TaxID=1734446 RepID=UPI00202176B1|nr:N-6 DNA methylase [Actinoplanes maris]